MPTRPQTRRGAVAKASLGGFSRGASSWGFNNSCAGRGLDSSQTVIVTVCRTFTPDQGFTDLLPFGWAGTVHRPAAVAGRPCWRGSGWQSQVAVGSPHSRFLRGDLRVRTDPSME